MFAEYLNNLPSSIIIAIGMSLICKNLIQQKSNKTLAYKITIILCFASVLSLNTRIIYAPIQTFLIFLLVFINTKVLFDTTISETFILSVTSVLVLIFSETVIYINYDFIKNSIYINREPILSMIMCFSSLAIGYLLTNIKFIKDIIGIFIKKLDYNNTNLQYIVFVLLTFIILFFYYQLFDTKYIEGNNTNFIIYIIALIILFFVFVYDKIRYKDLLERYNSLFEYACTFEEELDKDKLIRHEYKNQLAVIKDMSSESTVIEYIKSTLKNLKENDEKFIKGINKLPKGGLRGVIYYKIHVIKSKKINFNIEISKNIKNKLQLLKDEELKMISYIIGVCSDNAIDECSNIKDGIISIEIYDVEDKIKIVISNTIKKIIDLHKVGKKGYSTKGTGHGNGVFMINRMIRNHPNISMNNKIINDYYVQEINIDI